MRQIPIAVLLSWPTPNYINPPTHGHALVIVNAVLLFLVITIVALRIYTRIAVKRWFGADDAFIALALLSSVALTICVILANQKYYWDRHVWDIPIQTIPATLKIAFVAKLLFTFAATFTRLSIFSFYFRLVKDSGKNIFILAIHANVAFSIAILITFICLVIFQCNPVSSYWSLGLGKCLDEGPVTLASGVINTVADLFATLLPIPMVIGLQMPLRQRMAVILLFSLGFMVVGAGIARSYYIWKALMESYDETWYAYSLWISAAVEINLGVICASAPVLRPLLSKIPLSTFSSRFTHSRKSSKRQSTTLNNSNHLHSTSQKAHYQNLSDELSNKADSDAIPLGLIPEHQRQQQQHVEQEQHVGSECQRSNDAEQAPVQAGGSWNDRSWHGGLETPEPYATDTAPTHQMRSSVSESQGTFLASDFETEQVLGVAVDHDRARALGWRAPAPPPQSPLPDTPSASSAPRRASSAAQRLKRVLSRKNSQKLARAKSSGSDAAAGAPRAQPPPGTEAEWM